MAPEIVSDGVAGNRLCLDFVNLPFTPGSLEARKPSWLEIVEFLAAKSIVSRERSEELAGLPENDANAARNLLMQSERLASGMRLAFRAAVRGSRIHEQWIEPINTILRVTEGHDELVWSLSGWRLQFLAKDEGLEWLLAAIARSGAELLVEEDKESLRECSNPNCRLLFYDDSRTHRRRWCSMALCGNRNKVAAFADRQKSLKARAHHA